MGRSLFAVAALVACAYAAWARSALADEDAYLYRSRALVAEFDARLKAELSTTLERRGPLAALAVCRKVASEIAAELSARSGAKIVRTSRRYRSVANTATDWQAAVLEALDALAARGAVRDREFFTRRPDSIRYLRPILIEDLCLSCHGKDLAPDVSAALAREYPGDPAAGYAVGELRGAYVVEWPRPVLDDPRDP